MAGWALGLAIIPCLLTLLISIGLAVAALVRSARRGRDHGRALAIAALVVASCWVILTAAAVGVAIVQELVSEPDRDSSGQVSEAGALGSHEIRVGDCFDSDEILDSSGPGAGEVMAVDAIPCDEPHQVEAYASTTIPDGAFPGVDEVAGMAGRHCLASFKGFVGVHYRKSELEPFVLYPTAMSWRLEDDRVITCLITDPGQVTTGTLEGARR